jgi:hypothetical protein
MPRDGSMTPRDLVGQGSVAAGPILVGLATMALVLGERSRLSRCYDALLPFAAQYYWFLVDRMLGELAVGLGEWAAAERHFAAAEAQAAREGQAHPAFQPQAQWVGYTPAFRIRYDVHGDRAHLYFECLWVDKAAGKIAAHTNSDDTLARINGRWLIKEMKAAAVDGL